MHYILKVDFTPIGHGRIDKGTRVALASVRWSHSLGQFCAVVYLPDSRIPYDIPIPVFNFVMENVK